MAKSRTSPQPRNARTRRSPTRYKSSETRRLLKGAKDAGLTVRAIEVDPVTGALRVLVGKPDITKPDSDLNEWDDVR